MATIDIYDKGQVDALLSGKADTTDLPSAAELVPDYSGASANDVLTIENGAPVWKAAGGSGGTFREFSTPTAFQTWLSEAKAGDVILSLWYSTGSTYNILVTGWWIGTLDTGTPGELSGWSAGVMKDGGSRAYINMATVSSSRDSITVYTSAAVTTTFASMNAGRFRALVYVS